jgi:hypothetical protein
MGSAYFPVPVSQRLSGKAYSQTGELLLLAIERHAFNVFLGHDVGQG